MELWSWQDPYLREVVWFALCCRAATLLLQALFNLLIPDHAADAFSPPRLSEAGPWDAVVERLLGGLSRWDAEHFLFIAERGYLYEHNCAFLPLYPLSLRAAAAGLLWPLGRLLRARSRLLLAAAGLSSLCSVLAAAALYGLGRAVLRSRPVAFLAALLFSLSPASVFLAAAYSESMFACLAFGAMWQLERGQSWLSGLLFCLASGVRANGLLNAGFLLYSRGKRFALRLQAAPGSVGKLPPLWKQLLSLASSAVLDSYWDVGFLRYFKLRQIPNFLLALPVTLLGSWAAWTYVTANPRHCLTLGLERRKSEEGKPRAGFCSPALFVYVVHATALLVFGFFCMHVQVLTRFLGSSSPILYWFSAHLLQEHEPLLRSEGTGDQTVAPHTEKSLLASPDGSRCRGTPENPLVRLLLNYRLITPLSKCLLGFFLSYWLLGLMLHCNFWPWT
ncbi:GPI mannosyltransferase 2 isoform X2 [Pogoniulus pusillus]|uniref:GPI mannosyltransferase 2 isoform X2 n=1 Tax=Pogoniulus pusillus TaxID=488313 RepID=UPI0030B96096